MKRILITGASGFIGGFLVEEGLNRDWEVTAAVRPTSDKQWLQDPRIRFLELNFNDGNDLQNKLKATGRFDYIIHNAGSTKEPSREKYFASNFHNTKRLAEALIANNQAPEKFLYVSSLAAIGPTKYNHQLKPGQLPNPVTFYGESKLATEQYLASLTDFAWTAVQPTAVFGPREKGVFIAIKLAAKGWAFQIGTRPQQLSFIYVKDLVTLMYSALEHGHSGKKYLATDGKVYANVEVGMAVEAVTKRSTVQVKVPLPVIRAAAILSEMAGKINGQVPPLNREKLPELAAESWNCDMSETLGDLHFQPRYDLYSGMEETVRWYKEHKWF